MKLTFKKFITEAIPLSNYRNVHSHIDKDYKNRYSKWFGGKWRLYFPLDGENKDELFYEIDSILSAKNYTISDWKNGLAKSKVSDRFQRIGKILSADEQYKDVYKKFVERFKGKSVDISSSHMVVISRHPYDIVGQSFDRQYYKNRVTGEILTPDKYSELEKKYFYIRHNGEDEELEEWMKENHWEDWNRHGWDSCKNFIDGSNNHYVVSEINEGALIAYVTTPDDKNLKKPIGRILLIPIENVSDSYDKKLYVTPQIYGKYVNGFFDFVEKWLEEKQGPLDLEEYCVDDEFIYNGDVNLKIKNQYLELVHWLTSSKEFTVMSDSNNEYRLHGPIYFLDDYIKTIYATNFSQIWNMDVLLNDFEIMYSRDNFENTEVYHYISSNKTLLDATYNVYKREGGQLPLNMFMEDIEDVCVDFIEDITLWFDLEEFKRKVNNYKQFFHRICGDNDFVIEIDEHKKRLIVTLDRVTIGDWKIQPENFGDMIIDIGRKLANEFEEDDYTPTIAEIADKINSYS